MGSFSGPISSLNSLASARGRLASRGGRGTRARVRTSDRKGAYATYVPLELEEVEKWNGMSDVSPVISSTMVATRRSAGRRDRNQRTENVSKNGGVGLKCSVSETGGLRL